MHIMSLHSPGTELTPSNFNIRVFHGGQMFRNPNKLKRNEAVGLDIPEQVAKQVGFTVASRHLMVFEPGGYGGDHEHEREELMMVTSGQATLIHRDKDDELVHTLMGPDQEGNLNIFYVASWMPHAVINGGPEPATLYELRDRVSSNYTDFSGTPQSMIPSDFLSHKELL